METNSLASAARPGHETRDANPRALAYFAGGLFVILALILLFTRWLFFYLSVQQPLGPPPTPFESARSLPPEPRLQVAPAEDLESYLQAQRETLNSYGWVNRETGIVRIPIDRAMELLLERGLPARAESPPADAAEVPTDSGGPATAAAPQR
jgi:hypothetical protein